MISRFSSNFFKMGGRAIHSVSLRLPKQGNVLLPNHRLAAGSVITQSQEAKYGAGASHKAKSMPFWPSVAGLVGVVAGSAIVKTEESSTDELVSDEDFYGVFFDRDMDPLKLVDYFDLNMCDDYVTDRLFIKSEIDLKSDECEDFRYTGQIKDGVPNGYGTGVFKDFKIEGTWRDCKVHGKALMTGTGPVKFGCIVHYKNGTLSFVESSVNVADGVYRKGNIGDGIANGESLVVYDWKKQPFLRLGSVWRGNYAFNVPVLSPNLFLNPNPIEKNVIARFYRMVLDDVGVFLTEIIKVDGILKFKNSLIPKILQQVLPEYKEMFICKSIEDYVASIESDTGFFPDSTLELCFINHVALLNVRFVAQEQFELSFYDTAGSLGLRKTCLKTRVSREDLVDCLLVINKILKDDMTGWPKLFSRNFYTDIMSNKKFMAMSSDNKEQKLPSVGTCTLDCWISLLKDSLDERQWHEARAQIFKDARDFFRVEGNTGEYEGIELQEIKRLEQTAQEKYDRRVKRMQGPERVKRYEYKGEKNEDGVPHGHGSILYTDGRKLEGNFKNGVVVVDEAWKATSPDGGVSFAF